MDYLNIDRTEKRKSRERRIRDRIDRLELLIPRSMYRQVFFDELQKLRNELQIIRNMKPYIELSEHDQKIVNKLESLDEGGYAYWPEMSYLASQLEDEERKEYWHGVCVHYNHMEEASIGNL